MATSFPYGPDRTRRFAGSRWREHRARRPDRQGGTIEGRNPMGKLEDLKGRTKEAAGDITDDDELKREGKLDQASAKVKEGVDKVKDKIGDMFDRKR
jgi:uncharacterized protein YjbJ (UPF0337 family)